MPAPQSLPSRLIGALFVERGLVSESQIRVALEIQRETGQQLGQLLVERFGVSRKELASVVAEQWAKLGGSAGPEDTASWRRLGDIFVERGFVTQEELDEAPAAASEALEPVLAHAEPEEEPQPVEAQVEPEEDPQPVEAQVEPEEEPQPVEAQVEHVEEPQLLEAQVEQVEEPQLVEAQEECVEEPKPVEAQVEHVEEPQPTEVILTELHEALL